jgi:hypothetical protein
VLRCDEIERQERVQPDPGPALHANAFADVGGTRARPVEERAARGRDGGSERGAHDRDETASPHGGSTHDGRREVRYRFFGGSERA